MQFKNGVGGTDTLFLQSPSKGIESALELNGYLYAGNNPIMLVDPEGMKDEPFNEKKRQTYRQRFARKNSHLDSK